jgi:hypothetical protein
MNVCATTVAVEKYYIFWVCICSLRYPACNAHGLYCHLWPARLYNMFQHHLIKARQKKLIHHKCLFWFPLRLLSEAFPIPITERDMIKDAHWSSRTVPGILARFQWNLNFLDRFSKKNTQIHSVKIRPVGAELFHADGRTDGRTDATKLRVVFRNFGNAPCAHVEGMWVG